MLKFEGVKKHYEDFELDLTLEVPEGYVTGLIGANGAGKSTAFKAALGLIRPDAGVVKMLGKNVEDFTVQDKERGSQSVPRSAHTAPQCGPGNGFAGVTFQGMGSHRGAPRLEWPITSAFIRHYNRDMDRKGGTKAKYGRHSALK